MNGKYYDLLISPLEHLFITKWRKEIIPHAKGKTLEIGVGTGINFKLYVHDDVTGIEPDQEMLQVATAKNFRNFKLIQVGAENLPFEDNTFDTITTTLVLCSVKELDKCISEIYRVLKPGGELLLLEHIKHANSAIGFVQDTLNPIWTKFTDGCNLNRNPEELLISKGFKITYTKELGQGIFKLWHFKK